MSSQTTVTLNPTVCWPGSIGTAAISAAPSLVPGYGTGGAEPGDLRYRDHLAEVQLRQQRVLFGPALGVVESAGTCIADEL